MTNRHDDSDTGIPMWLWILLLVGGSPFVAGILHGALGL